MSDSATTAANIQAHELLYQSGLAAHLLVTVTNVPLAFIFYELFKVVNRRVALLTAFFILVATAIEAAGRPRPLRPHHDGAGTESGFPYGVVHNDGAPRGVLPYVRQRCLTFWCAKRFTHGLGIIPLGFGDREIR